MSDNFDFISPTDKAALVAFSTPDWLDAARAALQELGYKVHTAATHGDFTVRFAQIRYKVVVIEELFAANSLEENSTLQYLQQLPMNQRRHACTILLGDSFQTLTPMQAFRHSVAAVISSSEIFLLRQLFEKAIADNEFFMQSFREAQAGVLAEGRPR